MLNDYYYRDQLESRRLITRFITAKDVIPWTEFFKSPEAIELFPTFGLHTIEERVQHWIVRQLIRYSENRYGLQMLIHKETGELIGQCGLLLQEVDGIKELEVGYHIISKHWGNGYAPEAARLFLDFAVEHDLADSVISIIDIRNSKSIRVAEKNGLQRDKQTRWMEKDVFIYRIQLPLIQ
jgi:ribosomal-protein-alanine N-acetyltransferase